MSALLEVREVSKHYPVAGGRTVKALDRVSVDVEAGEVLGIVGESGCGKSTLGRAVMRLIRTTAGSIRFEGDDLLALSAGDLKRRRRDLQMMFQDPFGSLNPRHKVGAIIREPLDVHGIGSRAEREKRVLELLDLVGLPAEAASRFPHQFSGGQRQRIALARALALEPKLLIADEPVSALDVSIQSQIINLIAALRKKLGLSIIFISHDLSVVRHVADRMAVMYLGRIVEIGTAAEVTDAPVHPYTEALLSAVPKPNAPEGRHRIVLSGELPDPADPPSGCTFRTRCPHAMPVCAEREPALVPRRRGAMVRTASCHLYEPT